MSRPSFGLRVVRGLARVMALAYPRTFRVAHYEAFAEIAEHRWRCEAAAGSPLEATAKTTRILIADTAAASGAIWLETLTGDDRTPAARGLIRYVGQWLGGAGADVRYTVRALRRAPWYSATVISVIALAMALATTVFAVVDGVLFKPLPYPDARQLFAISPGFSDVTPKFPPSISPLDLANWAAAAPGSVVTGFSVSRWVGLGEDVNGPHYGVAQVQANFFDAVGVQPLVGAFARDDFDHRSAIWPVIISYDLWQQHFQGAPDTVGRTVIADPSRGSGYRIVGIMPRQFEFPSGKAMVALITPYILDDAVQRDPSRRVFTEAIARAPRSMSRDALRARVEAGMMATAAVFPRRVPPPTVTARARRLAGPFDRAALEPIGRAMGSAERPLFSAIFFAALTLVALASLNVSGLMAARALDRGRELGLRRALGAGAGRIARIVMAEALGLVSVGALIAFVLAPALLRFSLHLLSEDIVLLKPAVIDWRVAAFVVLSVVLLVLLTSLWPIRRALRTRAGALADGGRASERARSASRSLVVALQVAGGVVLTVAGALLVSSVLAVYAHEPAIRTDHVVVIDTMLMGAGGEMNVVSPVRNDRVNAAMTRLRGVSGVEAVAVTNAQLLRGGSWPSWFVPPANAADKQIEIDVQAVTPEYYRVVQPVIVAGRLPTEAELVSNDPVVLVSEGVAHAYWPQEPAVGQALVNPGAHTTFTVIGVVKDVRWWSWDRDVASIYAPYALLGTAPFPTFMIRTSADVGRVTRDALQTIERTDPLMRPVRSATLSELFADSVQLRRLQSWMFGSFAITALAVIGAGVLGLMAMAMARRVREVGIRMALGSTRPGVVALLLREQLAAVTIGVAVGGLAAAWTVRLLKSYLYQITAYDPRPWTVAIVAIVLTAAIGTLIPSLRASRVDPVQALRAE